MLLRLSGQDGCVTQTSLTLPAKLSFEEWSEVGEKLQRCESAILWWWGDWWLHGERAYGEAAAQAAPTGYSSETLRGAAWVCSKIPVNERRTSVSFAFHQEVAALESVRRRTLLEQAEDEGWNRQELRRQVKRVKLLANGTPSLPTSKYRVIYADPPWNYGDKLIEGYGAAEHHYPSMSIEALCELPIIDMAETAVSAMWEHGIC